MSQAGQTEAHSEKRLQCPGCGNKGQSVKAMTLQSLVIPSALERIGQPEAFCFCPAPACDVAYFRPQTGERVLCAEVRVGIGQKAGIAPRTVCYCFGHTYEQLAEEVTKTGTSRIPDEITAKCRQGLGRCEETNPQGSCCLGNVRRALASISPGQAPEQGTCCGK